MKEISEEFLLGYRKEASIVFSSTSNYLMVLVVFLSFIYLVLNGNRYWLAIFILGLAAVYGIYKELRRKCNSCGKRYEQAALKKPLNGPEYSELHQSFKVSTVQFCSICKKYSELESEPPSW